MQAPWPLPADKHSLFQSMASKLTLAFLLAAACATSISITAQAPRYDIESIGSLSSGYPNDSWGAGINNLGVVVGISKDVNAIGMPMLKPVRWTPAGLVQLANTIGSARAINSSGTSVGFKSVSVGGFRAYRWGLSGSGNQVHFGTLPSSSAFDINEAGSIVGRSDFLISSPVNSQRGFYRGPLGSYTSMGSLGGVQSAAHGINNHGQVCGSADNDSGDPQAVAWTPGSPPVALGVGGVWSSALAINDSNSICGVFGDSINPYQGFVVNQGAVYSLPTLWPGEDATPVAINQFGYIVGTSGSLGSSRAILWEPGRAACDLQALLPAGSGWVLETAGDINDLGEITGKGVYNGQVRGYRMTPQSTVPLCGGVQPAITNSIHAGLFAARVNPNSLVHFYAAKRLGRTWSGSYYVNLANPTFIGATISDSFGRARFGASLASGLAGITIHTQSIDVATGKGSRVTTQLIQ